MSRTRRTEVAVENVVQEESTAVVPPSKWLMDIAGRVNRFDYLTVARAATIPHPSGDRQSTLRQCSPHLLRTYIVTDSRFSSRNHLQNHYIHENAATPCFRVVDDFPNQIVLRDPMMA